MRKDLGVKAAVFPMPVLMIATYDENGVVDVMNAAWGTVSDRDKVSLVLSESHKTVKNIKINKAFTVSLADVKNIKEADFFGMASGNTMPDKFEKSGMTAIKSGRVNAPIIDEFPVTMECELAEIVSTDNAYFIVGRILNTSVREDIIDENGEVDIWKAGILTFNQFNRSYYLTGENAATAWDAGKELMG